MERCIHLQKLSKKDTCGPSCSWFGFVSGPEKQTIKPGLPQKVTQLAELEPGFSTSNVWHESKLILSQVKSKLFTQMRKDHKAHKHPAG